MEHVWVYTVSPAGLGEELLSAWALRFQECFEENGNALPERRVATVTRQQCKHECRGGRARVSQGYIHFCS